MERNPGSNGRQSGPASQKVRFYGMGLDQVRSGCDHHTAETFCDVAIEPAALRNGLHRNAESFGLVEKPG